MDCRVFRPFLFLLVPFLMISCGDSGKKNAKPPMRGGGPGGGGGMRALSADAYIITPEVLKSSLQIAGTLLPMEVTEIHPEVSGKVTMLSVQEGAWVQKGTLLGRLFDGDLRAQLQKLKVQLQVAEKTEQRQNDLLAIGGISQQDYDLSVLNVNSLRADIAVLETEIEKTYIRAPFSGRLGFKNISVGAYITPQTIVTTIRQVDRLKLEFNVPEKYSNEVKVGNKVRFSTETTEGVQTATIMTIESGISENTRTLAVHAVVNNADNKLKPGGFAYVDFKLAEDDRAVLIPSQCIIPGARDKEVILFKGGRAEFVVVETGVRSADRIEITKGLTIGDTVLTTGLLSIKPGSQVTISSFQKDDES
ncbi:MAG: efflux RND transporter periplasmic adaptor subunit [Chitinophagaceae bacterium]|nr:efflux RND transporter periplasmic adaptor subunit [Chitinophagaceae bacterium]